MIKDLAVAICTRNRPASALKAIRSIESQNPLPRFVIVVDSSDDDRLEKNLVGDHFAFELTYLRANSGLPHQRNVALDYAAKLGVKNLVYMDDDVTWHNPTSIAALNEELADPGTAIVAPFDLALKSNKRSWIRRALNLGDTTQQGRILPSGVCVPTQLPRLPIHKLEVEWVPGLAFMIRVADGLQVRFPDYVHFFGEDLEFQSKFVGKRKLLMVSEASVLHDSSNLNRASQVESRYWDLAYKFRLASLRNQVRPSWVVTYAVLTSVHFLLRAGSLREFIEYQRATIRGIKSGLTNGEDYGREGT